MLDVSGSSHLWGGDKPYLTEIINRLKSQGYGVRAVMVIQ
jgi:protein ImuB